MKKLFIVTLLLTLVVASGCSPAPEEPAAPGSAAEDTQAPAQERPTNVAEPVSVDPSQLTSEPSGEGGPVEMPVPGGRASEESLLHFVSLDLSKRLDIDISEVVLIEMVEVTWPSGALGCPAADVDYTQAEVAGYQITLEAQGEQYVYHTTGLTAFIWCDSGTPVEPLDS